MVGFRFAKGRLFAERKATLPSCGVRLVVEARFPARPAVVGLALSALGAHLLEMPFVLKPCTILAAFLFAGAVGVIFGYFPARKAARLNPIEALRYE